jgi:hypothetical protein
MKFLVFFVLLAFASAWFMAGNRAREQHPLDANGCHTSPRTGVYHCHTGGAPHPEDGEAVAADETYLPPGVAPAPGAPAE